MSTAAEKQKMRVDELLAHLKSLKDYVVIAAKLKSQQSVFPGQTLKELIDTSKDTSYLNSATKKAIIDFAESLPPGIDPKVFSKEKSMTDFLNDLYEETNKAHLIKFRSLLIALGERQEAAQFWQGVTQRIGIGVDAVKLVLLPLRDVPIVNLVARPILGGINYGMAWLRAYTFKNTPGLSTEMTQLESNTKKVSFAVGFTASTLAMVTLVSAAIPPLWPVLPILGIAATVGFLTSSVLDTGSAIKNFYNEVTKGKKDKARPWRLFNKGNSLFSSLASIALGAMAVAALFTPVGWAAGAGLLAFGLVAAALPIVSLAINKLTGKKIEKLSKEPAPEPAPSKPEVQLDKKPSTAPEFGPRLERINASFEELERTKTSQIPLSTAEPEERRAETTPETEKPVEEPEPKPQPKGTRPKKKDE